MVDCIGVCFVICLCNLVCCLFKTLGIIGAVGLLLGWRLLLLVIFKI